MRLILTKPSAWPKPAVYTTDEPRTIYGVHIPAGFETDGASVPWWLPIAGIALLIAGHWLWLCFIPGVFLVLTLSLFPRFGKTFDAALLHDYLLVKYPREWKNANHLFLQQLKADGISLWRAYPMFWAVTVYQFFKSLTRFFNRKL